MREDSLTSAEDARGGREAGRSACSLLPAAPRLLQELRQARSAQRSGPGRRVRDTGPGPDSHALPGTCPGWGPAVPQTHSPAPRLPYLAQLCHAGRRARGPAGRAGRTRGRAPSPWPGAPRGGAAGVSQPRGGREAEGEGTGGRPAGAPGWRAKRAVGSAARRGAAARGAARAIAPDAQLRPREAGAGASAEPEPEPELGPEKGEGRRRA